MKLLKIMLLLVLVVGGGYVGYQKYFITENEHVHYHAGFVVYIDGVKQDYSDYKYMNWKPCTQVQGETTEEDEQIEKAHLHDSVGDVVHVEQAGSVWGDLFKNIGINLPADLPNLNDPIVANSSIVITVGKPVDNPEKVSLEHIKEVEVKSELCGNN